jgi:peptidoglycan/LPS O-acetylase OafA/YrhL
MQFKVVPSRQLLSATRQIIGIDAIRCLAAVLVMIFHLSYWIWAGQAFHPGLGVVPPDYIWLAPFAAPGWVGVQVFFVISGFVIVYSADGTTAFRFLRSRILRLAPAAWICASITAAALLVSGTGYLTIGKLAKSWLKAVIFYPYLGWIDTSYWTLGIELGFYAVVFTVLAAGIGHRIYRVVALFGLISSAFWIVSFATNNSLGPTDLLPRIAIFRTTDLLLLQHGCFFALGAFLCLAKYRRLSSLELGCVLLFVAAGSLQIVYTTRFLDRLTGVNQPAIAPLLIWLACVGAVVASIRWNSVLAGFGPRFVALLRSIGLMTYPLYLIHQFVGYVIIDEMRKFVTDSAALVVAIAACLGLAFIVSRYAEPALRTVLAAWLPRAHTGTISLIERA